MSKKDPHITEPPYALTPGILNLVAKTAELMGKITAHTNPKELRLHRINRIRTVHGSCAIEGNTLSELQVLAVFEGKQIIAPPREIQEVRNAIKVYDLLSKWSANKKPICWQLTNC